MCGIVGYIGYKKAVDVLQKGLKKLEYRGYDSAGISVIEEDNLKTVKTKGRLYDLTDILEKENFTSSIGIGHTRWATHGKPSDANSHPHQDCSNNISIVHNGIIENYQSLKAQLQEKGHTFNSETDTEVIAHLIEENYDGDILKTVINIQEKLEGSYALGVLHQKEPDKIVCTRKDSPLIVGVGENENVIASDIPAILDYTREAIILDDGETGLVKQDEVTIYDENAKEVTKETMEINWNTEEAEKGGYDHFMLKEIHEQPKAVKETVRGRVQKDSVDLEELSLTKEEISSFNKIDIVACGTAYHAGLIGKSLFESLARVPVEVSIASEFRYRDPLLSNNNLVIVISQSGETADTLAALRESQKRGAKVLAITNVVGSSVSREADEVIYTWAGPEIAVASTKAYVTQLVALSLLATYFAQTKKTITSERLDQLVTTINSLPEHVERIFEYEDEILDIAKKVSKYENAFFIGRSLDWAVAEEAALKLKEISYIHAEAYAAGELKHGTLALIVDNVPVISLATQPHVYEKTISNLQEVKARGAQCITVVNEDDTEINNESDQIIRIPNIDPLLSPILSVIPLQLLSYYAAVARGTDVDKPRNLAKSVTVE
ncbi:glutamine--fructose-6-phosphate transaminase (isomerizing) [Natranaerobius trueperi]|uniref:Glutamine--fructose-6-phosphate aminotransferase [isomerizing] n=1 Tax=Natranaerobius trueperi TaxID=759412 RepID=A0A226BZS3_9FIRM|nr:glutamine--fructose-6-phosphate transaminase (isomerizing) [Natranaerobius trueperi]OWZ84445.1 glutamine--fructose-6-phosphate transaminase (isomerizing) [Natranaerobius trueperi]